ncbi:MAG: ribonuclease H-like domain-containing protein [Nitrospira sp.]|nr:ribonuclease H-like domain-containing protein [Nitrospira sp.]
MAQSDIIVLDLETQKSFDEVGGRDHLHKLLVSVVGLYSYEKDQFITYTEPELFHLFPVLEEARLIIGFNIKRFDFKVLEPYHHRPLTQLPTLDILEEVVKILGHRLRLETLAQATLGRGKIGTGLDAIRYFQQGQLDKLKAYCLEDVKVTRDLYEYGKLHRKLLYYDRPGENVLTFSVQWEDPSPRQATLRLTSD